jgi:hypothetical protein
MESEDKVPLVELTFPCGLKGKVYSDQSGMGGMYEVCSRQCPNPEVGGDVNRCEPFKKYDKAIYSERAKVLRKEIHLSERKKEKKFASVTHAIEYALETIRKQEP